MVPVPLLVIGAAAIVIEPVVVVIQRGVNRQLVFSFDAHIRRPGRGAWLQHSGDLQVWILVEEKQRTLERNVPDNVVSMACAKLLRMNSVE